MADRPVLFEGLHELLEETGYQADEWRFLGRYAVDGNRGSGHAHFYLATQAYKASDVEEATDLEEMELLQLSRAEVVAALDAHEFKVVTWAANMALALMYV